MLNMERKRAGAKLTLIMLSALLLLLMFASPALAVTLGDVTEDGNINVLDVVLVMQHILGLADPELTASQKAAADVNCDGDINVQDANLIMQKVLKLIDEFPCDPPDEELSVTAKATGKKIITVSFNKAVSNPEDAELTVIREPSTIPVSHITTSWNEANTEVELRRSVNYVPGDYMVTVKGLELNRVHYSFTIEPERVGKILITSPNLVIGPTNPWAVRGHYRVYNQYGEDITSHPLASNLKWGSSLGDVASITDDNEGAVTVTVPGWTTPFTIADELTLTAVDPPSEVMTSRRVGVVDTMTIEAFKFGEITPLPKPRRVVEIGWDPAARILIDRALDDRGINRNTFGELQGQISIISSDDRVVPYLRDKDYGFQSDKQAAIYVDTTGMPVEKTISISVVINATGERFMMPLTIGEDPYARAVEIGTIENGKAYGDRSSVIASGDGIIYLPLTIRDQYGDERTNWQIAADYLNNRFKFDSTNDTVIDKANISIETAFDSRYRGYLKITDIGAVGYSTIRVEVVDTGKYDLKEIVVSPPRKPAEIHLPAAITRLAPPYYRMTQGSTTNFRFVYADQYGDSYAATIADNANFRVYVSVEKYSIEGDVKALELSPVDVDTPTRAYKIDTVTTAQLENRYTLTASNTLTGVSKVKGVLQVIDGKDLFETKTYIEVVEEFIARLRDAHVDDLLGDLEGQTQEFRFTLEGRMSFGTEITIDIDDSKGARYSDDPLDYTISGATGEITGVSVDSLGRDPVITFETRQLFIPDGRTIVITAENVNTIRRDESDIEVVFTRKDSDATAVATFDILP